MWSKVDFKENHNAEWGVAHILLWRRPNMGTDNQREDLAVLGTVLQQQLDQS